jgi:hypothetical protein
MIVFHFSISLDQALRKVPAKSPWLCGRDSGNIVPNMDCKALARAEEYFPCIAQQLDRIWTLMKKGTQRNG